MIKHKSLIIRILLILCLGVFAYFLSSLVLGNKVLNAINEQGPAITQTDLSAQSAFISPVTGKGAIRGLHLKNPEGYESAHALWCAKVHVSLSWPSLFGSGPVEVNQVRFTNPTLAFEKTIRSSNFNEIYDNISEPEPMPEDATHFTLSSLMMEKGRVATRIGDRAVLLQMPSSSKSDLDGELTPEAFTREMLNALMRNIGAAKAEASQQIRQNGLGSVNAINGSLEDVFWELNRSSEP